MYTLEEIAALRQKCNDYKLENREILEKYSDEELQKICNGIGPDCFPGAARKIVDKLHPSLEPVAVVHDVEWWESDGSRASFYASNERFKCNGRKCALAEYPWYDLRRYWVMHKARQFGNLCQVFGWEFYKGCSKSNET